MVENPYPQSFAPKKNFFSRARNFKKFMNFMNFHENFLDEKNEILARPKNFRTPHGRSRTRYKILRRALKFLRTRQKF